ncbi:GNAT family N-acetyltransferase [Propioniciclava soli]|uniref:GNAT family N-acetyltransferase n=1 Tax=Propioniciclava soli TaxID=2775081 RepID=A0ABZ3C671_9ACTN|nr:GNAT family N-acetyltransferase [Propioniciclava soli]
MQSLFASYEPQQHGVPLDGVVVREGTPADAEPTGRLAAEREGDTPARWADRHAHKLADGDHRLLVAEAAGEIVGHGWVSYLRPTEGGGRGAPDGWYLSGMVVAPGARRRGVGRLLTRARVASVLEHDDAVYYVVSASNRASRDLHAELGFTEVSDDFVLPGVVFGADDGILCRLTRDAFARDAEVVDLAEHRARRSADDPTG